MNKFVPPLVRFLVCTLLLATSALRAAHYYEATTTEPSQKKRGTIEKKIRAWVDGDSSCVEIVSGEQSEFLTPGCYLVTTDGGETVHLVNPTKKTYGEFSLKNIAAGLGTAMAAMKQMGGMMKLEVSDYSSEKVLEEPGGNMLGHATTHYRYQSHYAFR